MDEEASQPGADGDADVEAREAELETELEEHLRELEALEQRMRKLSSSEGEAASAEAAAALSDLPFGRLCLFLPAAALVALRAGDRCLEGLALELLDQLAEHRQASDCAGPPLLLSLLRFSHCVQAPSFELRQAMEAEGWQARDLKLGYAVEMLPPGWTELAEDVRWCPLRLRGRYAARGRFSLAAGAGGGQGWQRSAWRLGRHVTPRVLRAELLVEWAPGEESRRSSGGGGDDGAADAPRIGLSLVDSAVPKQPLFSLWLVGPGDGAGPDEDGDGSSGTRTAEAAIGPALLRGSVREVASCGGRAGAWQYKQRPWPLGPAMAAPSSPSAPEATPIDQGSSKVVASSICWTNLHIEFDWDAALCAALVDGRVEGPLDMHSQQSQHTTVGWVDSTEFGGAHPTVDTLYIDVAAGFSVAFSELLVG